MLVLQYVLTGLCLLGALVVLAQIVRDQAPGGLVLGLLAVVELGLAVQLVLGVLRVLGPHAGVSVPTYVGYLLGSLLILPVGGIWSLSERSRGGTAVLLVALLLVPFLFLRLAQVWGTHA
ncbi:MAG TPA: hypothetical protein VFM09_15070 [Marmoricola sp.]|nr:hypothetical protein [Marmoricola sp.]